MPSVNTGHKETGDEELFCSFSVCGLGPVESPCRKPRPTAARFSVLVQVKCVSICKEENGRDGWERRRS